MGDEQGDLQSGDRKPPRVFVTYSHDSEEHKDLVLQFCTFLRVDVGVDVRLDRWYEDARRDWSVWAIQQLAEADFILVIASPGYRRRVDGWAAADEGRGAQFEGAIIRDSLMRNMSAETRRVLPVVLPGQSISEIPTFLHAYSSSHYTVSEFTLTGVGELLAVLTGVPRHRMPTRGHFVGSPFESESFTARPIPAHRQEAVRGSAPAQLVQPAGRGHDPQTIALVFAATGLAALAGLMWSGGKELVPAAASVWSLLIGGAALVVVLARRRTTGFQALDRVCQDLATAVHGQWRAEERFRRLQDPVPIQTRWEACGRPELQDHWVNIGFGSHESDVHPYPAGRLDEIADFFVRVPSRRLVVLGEPGAGKTVLALRLTLDLLHRCTPEDPVPILFAVASWDPSRESLHDWMVTRLITDYPGLNAPSDRRSTVAAAVVETGRVLPILDGLDEMPAALRATAIRRINAAFHHGDPLVVTCRVDEYARAVSEADVITAAAVIILRPLGIDDLADYLPRTARRAAGALATGKWDPVLAFLRGHGQQHHAGGLLAVLSLPLMTSLARAAYSDTAADPAELVRDERFAAPATVADHLVDQMIPVAYDELLGDRRQRRWTADQARRWLEYLAAHTDVADGYGFAWWRLERILPRAVVATVGVIVGIIGSGLPMTLLADMEVGVLAGLVGGVASGLVSLSLLPVPSTVRLRLRGVLNTVRMHNPPRSAHVGWPVATVLLALALWLASGPVGAVLAGITIVVAFGLDAWFDVPVEVGQASGPGWLLRADRTAALSRGVARGSVIGITVGLIAGPAPGVGFGLGAILVSIAYTSWGRFAVARMWLALYGKLPWRLMLFLNDAHRRGILRQSGAVYQFRHMILRDRLAMRPDTTGEEMV